MKKAFITLEKVYSKGNKIPMSITIPASGNAASLLFEGMCSYIGEPILINTVTKMDSEDNMLIVVSFPNNKIGLHTTLCKVVDYINNNL